MKIAAFILCFALGACHGALEYDTSWPDPRRGDGRGPQMARTGDDITTEKNRPNRWRGGSPEAAAECAQYGRVAEHRGGDDYACVSADDAVAPQRDD